MGKEFLTYNQQMKYLRDKKKIVCGGTNDKSQLVSAGYFNLVNGYKMPFCVGRDGNGNHAYLPGTTIQELLELKHFDDELRMILFKYITIVEQEVRALAAYSFDNMNRYNSLTWYNVNAYNARQSVKVISVISRMYSDVSQSKKKYMSNYLTNHKVIPTWIMTKVIRFSNLINFIDCSKPALKDSLCETYSIKDEAGRNDYKLLIGSLNWLRTVRNSCAHNERIYDTHLSNERVKCKYFDLMSPSYNNRRNSQDKRIIDLMVYLKYYLDHRKYIDLHSEVKKLLEDLKSKMKTPVFDFVRAALGIRDLEHLEQLLMQPKYIRYYKHS